MPRILLQKLLDDHNIVLNDVELTEQNPVNVLSKYIPGNEWKISQGCI